MTILSGHVDWKNVKELHSHIRVEIRSAGDLSKVESFPLPHSNFFQVKGLPKGKHLVQLRSAMPSITGKFESEVIEVDLGRQPITHVGPLNFRIEEDIFKQVHLNCRPIVCIEIKLHSCKIELHCCVVFPSLIIFTCNCIFVIYSPVLHGYWI